MKMYDADQLAVALRLNEEGREILRASGVDKAFEIRRRLVVLKHEIKDALKAGQRVVDTHQLNERLQHIAKLPRPGLRARPRCNGRCRCNKSFGGGGR